MPVRANEDSLRLTTMVVEARFDDAYGYLDHCGAALSAIRREDRSWKPEEVNPQSGRLIHREKSLVTLMGSENLSLSRIGDDPLERAKADVIAGNLSSSANFMYSLVTESFAVPNTTRLGMRFGILALADSVEDADQFLVNVSRSDVNTELLRVTRSEMYSTVIRTSVEDPATGFRQNFMISAVRIKPDAPATGFGGAEDKIKGGVLVDIDTFTRPPLGNFLEIQSLVSGAYSRSFQQAVQIFQWIRTHQG